MKRKIAAKGLYAVLAAATVVTSFGGAASALPVFADENDGIQTMDAGDYLVNNGYLDFGEGNAQITINGNKGQSLVGKRFEVFRLFDAENATHGESINYTFNDKYAQALKTVVASALNKRDGSSLSAADVTEYMVIDYIQTLPEKGHETPEGATTDLPLQSSYSSFRYFVENVRDEIKREGITGDMVYVQGTTADNSITLQGLQYGYYIIDEVSTHDSDGDQYYASSLCMVDTANPNAEINIKSDYPEIIKKIQEDDNKEAIGDNGYNDIGDYEIGQTVPFQYRSTICDMNGYQTYYYAFHDQMDEELTLNDDSIQITINKGSKSYTLKDGEFSLVKDKAQLDKEDTFMVEISDIKKIVDREFNNKNQYGENDYSDLTVTLDYTATLNDLAADDTGRPGFENDVRLEFSNDADSEGEGETGYTPWDTVVCFTFKINGLKVNDHETSLEGAKFRLYSDPECKNEVYVKPKVDTQNDIATMAVTSGDTDNVTSPDGEEEDFDGNQVDVGANGYVVINRDSVGGDDHTGGTAPAEAVEMVSDADGNFTIYGLDQGTYYLKETKAPAGYRHLLDPITITITPTYTGDRNDYVAGEGATDETLQKLEATAHIKEFYDGQYAEGDAVLNTDIEDGSLDIKIVNEVGTQMPVTGSSAMLVLLGAGVALMGGALIVSRRKRA